MDLYRQQRDALLKLPNRVDQDYPDSVTTTWVVSFQRIEAQPPAAAELLRLCAYLAPDAIPEEVFPWNSVPRTRPGTNRGQWR